ncbi:tRNA lysidine(34) synthetase TilS [Corynebacterium matruchotii]|uniref:tRNA lysidine(34) synthetase TilS n=1 Tax=Corynebacterium matruchotii TaxID=43768 RepID=UPI0028806B15|nr:tRNA lysidine(34) synthetase TilS [Corynebacterium matruchotii]
MTSQEESAPLRRGRGSGSGRGPAQAQAPGQAQAGAKPAPGQAGEPPASTQAGAGSPRRPQPFWPDRSPAFLKLRRAVRALASEDPVLIGLSGGADSLGLVAAALAEGRDVLALCVDHGLQPDSATVADRAVAMARSLGAEARSVKVQVKPGNIEAQAREARYKALMTAAAAESRSVWVAHTMDDQAETYLLGSLRGRAVGMPVSGTVIRPFLSVRRADTVAACAELGLEVWHDPMNADPRFRRVRVRTEVLPLLADIHGGDPVPPLAAAASLARDDAAALDAQAIATAQVAEIACLPVALRRRAYLALVDAPLGPRHLEAIDSLVMDWHGQGPVAVAGFQVRRQGAELRVIPRST